jgi:uncharacterized protein YndB with AHSA1/START domain
MSDRPTDRGVPSGPAPQARGAGDTSLRVTTPSETEIVLTREFGARRGLVFEALTTPDLLKRWLGAHGWHLVECDVDLRVGGAWRFVSRGPGGATMGHGGVYREVVAPERLAYTESYDDHWYPGEALVPAVLTEAEDEVRTTLTTTLTYPSRKVRDAVTRTPMERGVGEGYARLDRVLHDLTTTTEGDTPP